MDTDSPIQDLRPNPSRRYQGFLSHAHASDKNFARTLQAHLLEIALPWRKTRPLRLFLDYTSLPAGKSSTEELLVEYLGQSERLLLLASPTSANPAKWVQKELQWWLENQSPNNVIIILTEGEIAWSSLDNDFDWNKTTALSRLLSKKYDKERLYVDLRENKTSFFKRTLLNLEYRSKLCKILSPLLGIPVETLFQADKIRHRKLLVSYALAGVLAAGALTTSYLLTLSRQLIDIRVEAEIAQHAFTNNDQIPALLSAVNAGVKLQRQTGAKDNFINTLLHKAQWAETRTAVTGNLQKILSGFHEYNRLTAHHDAVSAIDYHPSCQGSQALLVSGGKDGKVVFWRAGNQIDFVAAATAVHGGAVTSVAINPDCSLIASAGLDGKIKPWSTGGELIKDNVCSNPSALKTIRFAPNSGKLWLGDESGFLAACNPVTGAREIDVSQESGRLIGLSAQQCGDKSTLMLSLSASPKNPLKLWQANGKIQLLKQFAPVAAARLNSAALSPDCKFVAAGDEAGGIVLMDVNGRTLTTWATHAGQINHIHFSRDGQSIVTAHAPDISAPNQGDQAGIINITAIGGKPLPLFKHQGAVNQALFAGNDNTIISAGTDKTLRVWQVNKSPALNKIAYRMPASASVINAAGNKAFVNLSDGSAEVFDLPAQNPAKAILANVDSNAILFYPDDAPAVLARDIPALHLVLGNSEIAFNGAAQAQGVSVNLKRKLFAVYEGNNTISIYGANGRNLDKFTGYGHSYQNLAFDRDGKYLAYLDSEQNQASFKIRHIDAKSNLTLLTSKMHDAKINQLVFSQNGEKIATAGKDGLIKLWQRSGEFVRQFSAGKGQFTALALNPDNNIMAASLSGINGTEVILFSLQGEFSLRLYNAQGNLWDLKFNATGNRLVAAGQDSIYEWNLDLAELLTLGCGALKNYLTSHQTELGASEKRLCAVN